MLINIFYFSLISKTNILLDNYFNYLNPQTKCNNKLNLSYLNSLNV